MTGGRTYDVRIIFIYFKFMYVLTHSKPQNHGEEGHNPPRHSISTRSCTPYLPTRYPVPFHPLVYSDMGTPTISFLFFYLYTSLQVPCDKIRRKGLPYVATALLLLERETDGPLDMTTAPPRVFRPQPFDTITNTTLRLTPPPGMTRMTPNDVEEPHSLECETKGSFSTTSPLACSQVLVCLPPPIHTPSSLQRGLCYLPHLYLHFPSSPLPDSGSNSDRASEVRFDLFLPLVRMRLGPSIGMRNLDISRLVRR
jgi:hypothetical protein